MKKSLLVFLLSIVATCHAQLKFGSNAAFKKANSLQKNYFEGKFKLIDFDSDGKLDVFTSIDFYKNIKTKLSNPDKYRTDDILEIQDERLNIQTDHLLVNLIRRNNYKILEIEDSNSDGIIELYFYNTQDDQIVVKLNYQKDNTFYDGGMVFDGYSEFALYDADNDGFKDYVMGNKEELVIYQNTRFFNKQKVLLYKHVYQGIAKPAGTSEIVIHDFNKDGELDLFNGISFFYKKTKKVDFEISDPLNYNGLPFSLKNIHVADITNTGHASVLGEIAYNSSKIPFRIFQKNLSDSLFHSFANFNSTDLNNDGFLDLIFTENDSLKYRLFSKQNTAQKAKDFGTFEVVDSITFQKKSVRIDTLKYIGDADQDGILDLFVVSRNQLYRVSQLGVTTNKAPNSPILFISNGPTKNSLKISWKNGQDDTTPNSLLRYDFSIIGTEKRLVSTIGAELSFPVINSDFVTFDHAFEEVTSTFYPKSSSFLPNISAKKDSNNLMHKIFYFNYHVDSLKIFLKSIDNQGRISQSYPSIIYANFNPYSVTFDSLRAGEKSGIFRLSVFNLEGTPNSSVFLIQQKDGPKPALAYFKNSLSALEFPQNDVPSSEFSDFNNDGKIDLIVQSDSNLSSAHLSFDHSKIEHQQIASLKTKHSAFTYSFDADNDGDLDLFYSEQDSINAINFSNNLYQLTNQKRVWKKQKSDKLVLHSSDFDDDGENDLLVLNTTLNANTISILLNRKNGYITLQKELHTLTGDTKQLSEVDFMRYDVDGDGDFEIVILEKMAGNCVVFEQNKSGFYELVYKKTNANLLFFDQNGDGLVDFLDLNSKDIYQNNGHYSFSTLRYVNSFTNLYKTNVTITDQQNYKTTIATDFDHDSLVDLVSVDENGLWFFKNEQEIIKNKVPSIPIGLKAKTFEDTVALSWQKSIDNSTSAGLSYNIQLWKKETNQHLTPIHSLPDGRLLLNGKYTSIFNKHVFRQLTDGTYYWKVQAIDAGNLPSAFSEVDSFKVVIQPKIYGNKTACNYDTDTFYVSPRSAHYTWQISGGTEIITSDTSVQVKWHESGTQKIKVTNSKFGLSDSIFLKIKHNPVPDFRFHFPDASTTLKVQFETTQPDSIQIFAWEIMDSPYLSSSPIHSFNLPGKYDTKLTVSYKNECINSKEKFIYLFHPKIEGKKEICGISEETYNANPKGPAYKWEVTGGLVMSTINESIKIRWEETDDQPKTIKLINKEYSFTDSISIQVFPVPMVDFEVPENIGIGSLVQFKNKSIGTISTYLWDFDEPENTSITKNPTASFANSGQHKINLTLRNIEGCEASKSKTIIVSDEVSPILIANLLTPNSDGKNDLLYIENLERYPENEVRFYTAWGTEIFSQSNYQNDWDLRIGDQYISSGNYLCVLELKKFGKRFEKIVTVTR